MPPELSPCVDPLRLAGPAECSPSDDRRLALTLLGPAPGRSARSIEDERRLRMFWKSDTGGLEPRKVEVD